MSHAKKNTAQPSAAHTQEAFSVKEMSKSEQKEMGENFMDKSFEYSPQAILAAMKEFYENVLTNPQLKDLKYQLTTMMILGATPAAAFAEGEPTTLLNGQVTYTKFMEGITHHDIERVRIAADGRTAEFLNAEGGRGAVNLFNDPSLFKLLQDNQVDVSVLPPDQAGAALFGILNTLAFPLIFFGGIFLLNRARNGGPGGPGGDPMNPFNMGKSKAKV